MFGKKKRDIIIDERKEHEDVARTHPMNDKQRLKVFSRLQVPITLCVVIPIFNSFLLGLPTLQNSNVWNILIVWIFSTLVLEASVMEKIYRVW
jgi:hypothetical protein